MEERRGGGGGEVQHERDGRSDLVCCAFVSGICQVVRSIEAAEKLLVSVKVQAEHCHKTTLFQHRLYRSRPDTPGWRTNTSNYFLLLFLLPGWQMFCDFVDKNISFNSRGGKKPGRSSTKLE